MKQYLDSLQHILDNGENVDDRTGVGTRSVFGYQMRFNLQHGFPAVTTKRLMWKGVTGELLWFLEGSHNERRLAEITHGTRDADKKTIWTANYEQQGVELGYTNGELGPVYGAQWRSFNGADWMYPAGNKGFDQIEWLINEIQTNPNSRRLILSAWNPNQIEQMALPPCHTMAQFKVTNGKLSCQLYQRSADMFLGVPFNIASYSLFTHMLAQICNLEVGDFVHTIGDAHIYQNHMTQVAQQLERSPHELPILVMPEFADLEQLLATKVDDYKLLNYTPQTTIKAPMAV
jgi:thymidylate synthase